jgi:nucleoside-diphosphate-sugar epimerase
MVYGPGDDRNVSRIRGYLETHRVVPVFGSGERLQQPVFVRDVAQAVPQVLCRTATVRKTYVLGGPAPVSYIRMIDAVSSLTGRWVVKIYLPVRLSARLAGIHERRSANPRVTAEQVLRFDEEKTFDIGEARADFGFDPVPFEEGLRRIEAERGANPAPRDR